MQICSSASLAVKLNRLMLLHITTDGMELESVHKFSYLNDGLLFIVNAIQQIRRQLDQRTHLF